jgi:hypothetical protein
MSDVARALRRLIVTSLYGDFMPSQLIPTAGIPDAGGNRWLFTFLMFPRRVPPMIRSSRMRRSPEKGKPVAEGGRNDACPSDAKPATARRRKPETADAPWSLPGRAVTARRWLGRKTDAFRRCHPRALLTR